MPLLHIILDAEGCWADLKKHIDAMGDKAVIEVAALPGGMQSGNTSIAFRVEATTGEIMIFETSLKLLKTAVGAFIAKFGDPEGTSVSKEKRFDN